MDEAAVSRVSTAQSAGQQRAAVTYMIMEENKMKKRMVAMFLAGIMAAGGLALQMPAKVQAAELVTFEECDDSTTHINSSQVSMVDGKLTVTIDLKFETENADFYLYVFDQQLKKEKVGPFEFYPVDSYPPVATPVATLEKLTKGGTYTFDDLTGGKAYYVYCKVYDNHECHGWGEGGDPNDTYSHYAAYLGSSATAAPSNEPSESSSEDNDSPDDEPVNIPRDYAKEAEEKMLSQVKDAPAASTVAIDPGITTLSNALMKELQQRGDISLKLDFTYMGQKYIILIPAGAALDEDIPWYGPLYLAQHFGNSAETTGFEISAKETEEELLDQIKEAPAAATIVMGKGVTSLSNSVMRELSQKGDVSMRLAFTYENKEYVITIPAGAALDSDIPWYGPLYLIQHFGNSAETAD